MVLLIMPHTHTHTHTHTYIYRPDSKPVPAVDIVCHYRPDVVVSISIVVTMVIALVASRNPKPEHRGGGETRQQQRTGEEAAVSDTGTGVPQPVTLGVMLTSKSKTLTAWGELPLQSVVVCTGGCLLLSSIVWIWPSLL